MLLHQSIVVNWSKLIYHVLPISAQVCIASRELLDHLYIHLHVLDPPLFMQSTTGMTYLLQRALSQ